MSSGLTTFASCDEPDTNNDRQIPAPSERVPVCGWLPSSARARVVCAFKRVMSAKRSEGPRLLQIDICVVKNKNLSDPHSLHTKPEDLRLDAAEEVDSFAIECREPRGRAARLTPPCC